MSRFASGRAGITLAVFALALAACTGDEVIDPPFRDTMAPRVSVAKGNTVDDTLLSMTVGASDNIGLKRVRVILTGGMTATYDTIMTSAITTLSLNLTQKVPSNAPIGATVIARAVAFDGAGNQSDTARMALTIGNLEPPLVKVTSPVANSPVVTGKSLVIAYTGRARYKVRTIGFEITGAYNFKDSITYSAPLKDSVAVLDTLVMPDTVKGVTITVTPFITDSLNQRVTGTGVPYAVQSPTTATTLPVVRAGVAARVEVTDTIFVEATDPVGISVLGYEVRTLAGALIVADSVTSTGGLTSLLRTFKSRIPASTFPTPVTVTGFARNAAGRRDVTRSGLNVRSDTVQVVAGYTNPLPSGGQVADALYVPRTDRLYLTNIERNWLEVFNLSDTTFRTPIAVGSRPWGLAPWPRNRDGVMADTLIVANSGGTNLSYVDLTEGTTGREFYRYPLPNIIVYSITTTKAQQSDALIQQRTAFDFSDRPQFVATTCTGATTAGSPCQDVVVVYSTTPTPGQSTPFPNQGTLRWENVSKRSSHFFFEQAMGQTQDRADTLEIIRYQASGVGADSVLLPYRQRIQRADGTFFDYSIVAQLPLLAFRDTTFVRNSGNFRRAVFGEGGPVLGSRAMTFDATMGFDSTPPLPVIDRGISRPVDVTDFIANTFARVQGVGINFDGELNAVKGDSTYLFDRTLRLQGILQSRASIGGLDFHPLNRGANSTPLRTRLAFVASSEPVIDVFDTYCYRKIATVPIRDPIIGPVRATVRPNGQLVLVGATLRGVTLVALPDNFTTTCQ